MMLPLPSENIWAWLVGPLLYKYRGWVIAKVRPALAVITPPKLAVLPAYIAPPIPTPPATVSAPLFDALEAVVFLTLTSPPPAPEMASFMPGVDVPVANSMSPLALDWM